MPGRAREDRPQRRAARPGASSGRVAGRGQRGANAQPGDGSSRDGGLPGMARSGSSSVSSSRGSESSRARVYGCAGAANSTSTGACSTARPPYITSTSCATRATTPRSCVIMTTASPRSSWIRASSSRICACTVTSSAVVGSSAMSSSGSQASAMAIITRWRMPPENWCGYSPARRRGSGMPTSASASTARSRAAARRDRKCTRWCSAICSPTV